MLALRDAIKRFGTPATILSDNGSCFVGRGGRKASGKTWKATAFEAELLDRGIDSRVQQSFRLTLRRLAKDYFRLYRSAKRMKTKLTDKQIRYSNLLISSYEVSPYPQGQLPPRRKAGWGRWRST